MIREKLIFKVFVEAPAQTCPVEALDFITAHETATGVSMDQTQKDAVCGLVSRLQGNDTTNGSDLWTAFAAAGTELWPLAPSSNSVASSTGYRMELLSAAASGTYFNFVAGDFQPNGVTGDGSTKYFRTATNSDAFPQLDVAHGVMISQRNDTSNTILFGNDNGTNTNQVQFNSRVDRTDLRWRINDAGVFTQTVSAMPNTGLFIAQRDATDLKTFYVDGTQNGSLTGLFTYPTTVSQPMGFHSFIRSGSTLISPSSDRFSFYLYGMTALTANEHTDLYEALNWYQQNIITGGR